MERLPRQVLLDAVVDHLIARGPREQSLRSLAAAVGVTHSLVLYHFGSTAGLHAAVHDACMRRERDYVQQLPAKLTDVAPEEILTAAWRHLAAPEMWPLYRLGFALRVRVDVPGADHDVARQAWQQALAPLVERAGVPLADAEDEVTLRVATLRGLLWELICGGSPSAVDGAVRRFALRYAHPAPALSSS